MLIFCIFLFVDSFVGLYVTYSLYKQGRLRKNEAIISILNYPTLNIYLICHVSNRLKINIIALGLVLSIVFILTNLIICRVYPINNKQKIFLVKNKFKEKTFSKNKFKMAISLYLENKQKNKILSYFNEAINIVSNIMPVLLILFLFVDKIIINKDILNIAFSFYDRILIILKIPNYHYISKCITLGFFNPIYPIEAISCDVSFIARLIVAVILIGQGVFMSAVVFIKMNMSFITYRDILFVYFERILIMILIIFFAYYFYIGFSI